MPGYVGTGEPPLPEVADTVINPVVSALLRSPLHSLVSDDLLLLRFTGRRSGRAYTTPVGYWIRDGEAVITTQSPWWHNFEGGQPVSLLLRGEWREGVATPHADPEAVAPFVETFIDRFGLDAVRRTGVVVRGEREPTRAELEAGLDGLVVVTVAPTDDRGFRA